MEHPAASTETEPHKVSIPNGIFHGETMFPEGVDCGESGFPFSSHFPPHTFAEVRPQNWTDLTTDFSEWCQNLEPGELVSTPSFTLYDAMSAIELMDPKMDIGLLLKNRIIKSWEDGLEHGSLKLSGYTSTEYLAVIDRSLPFFILWMQGHCIAQTVFTMLYLHKPLQIQDDLMSTYCVALLELIEHVRQIMLDGGVVEEEDFQIMSPFAPPPDDAPTVARIASLPRSLKNAEETCGRNSRHYKTVFKETGAIADDQESSRWNAIALRFKFFRTLHHFLSSFRSRSETFFAEAPQQLDVLQTTLEKISTGYFLESKVVNEAPGFEPLVNLHLLPPSFPRHTPVTASEDTFVFMKKLVDQLRLVVIARENIRKIDTLMEFIRAECGLSSLALTRSMVQIVIHHSLETIHCGASNGSLLPWHVVPLAECIVESIRTLSNAPVLLLSIPPLEENTLIQEYMGTFLKSCVSVFSNLLRVYGLNKARQRDALGVALVDIFTLQEDAEKLDEFFSHHLTEMRLGGFTHSFCLASWTLMTMLNGMTDYLLSGFELELYADTELHFIYWYLYDVLYHCQVQTIVRADHAVRLNEAAYTQFQENEQRAARRNGKKKPTTKNKQALDIVNRPHRFLLTRAQSFHHLAGAYQFAVLGLQWHGKICTSFESLDCQEFRYYHRLMPFMERNAPAFVDYEHYRVVRSVIARPRHHPDDQTDPRSTSSSSTVNENGDGGDEINEGDEECIHDVYNKASQNFQQAEHYLSYWAKEDQRLRIAQICRRNDVILKILASGRPCKGVDLAFDLDPWFPSLKFQ